jgi:hypothetical protein
MTGGGAGRPLVNALIQLISSAVVNRPVSGSYETNRSLRMPMGAAALDTYNTVDSPPALAVCLRGHIDTANCGPIRFSLFGTELQAICDHAGGVQGGSFDISRMPMKRPIRLLDREGMRMQVIVTRLIDGVHCQVDDGLPDRLPTLHPYR